MLAMTVLSPAAVAGGVAALGLLSPRVANAQVSTVGDIPRELQKILNFIKDGLIAAAGVGIKNAIRSLLEKMAYDTAVWISSAGENQEPLAFIDQPGEYFTERADAAAGAFFSTLAEEGGFEYFNLCNLNADLSLSFQLILPQLVGREPYTPECTFSEQLNELEDYALSISEQFYSFVEDPDSMINVSLALGDFDGAVGSLLSAADQVGASEQKEERAAFVDRLKSDFKPTTAKISGYIYTPASYAEYQLENTVEKSTQGETETYGNIFADALVVFTSTLASKLLERATAGLFAFFTEVDISSSVAGDSSTAGSGGVKAAQEKFAEFKTPSFNPGGEISILDEFTSCPEEGAGVTNCVMDQLFRQAIEEGLTLNQAVNDWGLIDPNTPFAFSSTGGTITDVEEGISLRNIRIMRQYSVVPVGWELAALYNRDYDGTALTIGSVMEAYDDCDEGSYSPYCGLVDPDWPLKAPNVFCKLEGYATNIAAEEPVDSDGDGGNTPQQLFTARLTSCLDSQSCLSEDDEGSCEAYGYCVEQERIYRFEGDSCPSYYASCEYYTDADANEFSYLKNTLNSNDCSVDSVGCEWRCRQYNVVDEAFQCAGQDEVYETCTSDSATYDTADTECECTAADSTTCAIDEGGFTCETDSGESCTLGTETSDAVGFDTTINFDDDVATCPSEDAGCTEFIPVEGGANLLMNGGFEQYDNGDEDLAGALDSASTSPYDDIFGSEYNADASASNYTNPQATYGWEAVDGAAVRAVNEVLYGSAALQYDGDSGGGIVHRFETGQPLENRSFVLNFSYNNVDANTCSVTGSVFADPEIDASWPGISSMTESTDFDAGESSSSGFATYTTDVITFSEGVTDTTVGVLFNTTGTGCDIVLDGVKLEENSGSTGISDYQDEDDLLYVNVNEAFSCEVEEIGCNLYTPQTGESSTAIPGQITNELSDACGNGSSLDNAACSQCQAEYVGCEAYIEQETPHNAPIKDVSGFTDYLDSTFDADLAEAIAQRTGYYCEDTTTPCSPDRESLDCGSGVSCLPSTSIIPDTGDSCSAANVGCEEYVNLDQEALGGEGLEYYKYIRQCVKPTTQEIADGEVDTFYTFEGSDVSGYQLRSWYLKKSEIDSGPCTNLDLYGATSETPTADCVDGDQGLSADYDDCSAADIGDDPDCVEWFDSEGNNYYRYKSSTISVSDECLPLRNSFDDRIYYSIREESESCPASANLCREYKGSEGAAVQFIIDENFDDGDVWGEAEASGETVTASAGLSMALGTSSTNAATEASVTVADLIEEGSAYVVTFWAKTDTDGSVIYPYFYSSESGETNYLSEDDTELTTEWRKYTVGPYVFTDPLEGDEEFGFEFTDSYAYIDNVELQKSNSQYLILESADSCLGYEGCEEYSDVQDETHYLKSFTNLCSENVVGCQAVIATQNSDDPFYATYQGDNEWSSTNTPNDDVDVPADEATTIVVTDQVLCSSEVAACELTGLPDLDISDNPEGFTAQYIINDPDSYDTILCEEQQRSCEEYTDGQGSTVYFKAPGDKLCTYDSSTGSWLTADGDDCPLRNEDESPSQPKGAVCNGGERAGELCNSDSECQFSDDTETYRCVSNEDEDSGWVGVCSATYAGCTLYVDPNAPTLIDDYSFETDVKTNSDITSTDSDGIPDGWGVADSADGPNWFSYRDENTGPGSPIISSTSDISYESSDCSAFEQDTSYAFDRSNSLHLQTASGAKNCMAFPATLSSGVTNDLFVVDTNKSYTLSGNVYVLGSSNEFAIGLLFYDASGNELYNGRDPENYAFAAYEGDDRSEEAIVTDSWVNYHGTIGPNMTRTFPADTYYVRVFVEAGSDQSSIYFDDIGFSEDKEYTYLNYTVNGATENDGADDCVGEIDIANGCVGFRDTNDTSLTALSEVETQELVNPEFSDETCTFNDGDDSYACNSRPNTADTNVVLKVRNDRQCSEWLSCRSSRVTLNDAGEVESETCFQIGRCLERNEDTGACTQWADTRDSDSLGSDDELRITTQPGNTNDLIDIQDTSGFVTIGAEWVGSCVDNFCEGGNEDADGDGNVDSCSVDSDCTGTNIIYGYYPTDWQPEVGQGGAASTTDIVADGDFEDVYCDGDPESTTYATGVTYGDIAGGRDSNVKCTQDSHCRTLEVESLLEQALAEEEVEQSTDDLNYEAGWCGNFNGGSYGSQSQWEDYGGASVGIMDYEDGRAYTGTTAMNVPNGPAVASLDLDLNNVLMVDPVSGTGSGIKVDLGNAIVQGEEYVVTFDAQWLETVDDENDLIEVGLEHGAGLIDYFERGTGKADIVFAVDASSSMSSYISSVAENTAALVSGLEEAEVDFSVAIVTTGGSRQPKILDFDGYASADNAYDSDGTVTTDFLNADDDSDNENYVSDNFSAAMTYISSNLDGGSAYNYEMIANILDNSLNGGTESLNFRSGAQKFIILLTDTDPESGDAYTDGSWSQEDEDDFDATYGGADATLYSVIVSGLEGYDDLTDSLGGTQYNISGDYDEILDEIGADIGANVSDFTFSNTWESYALGPIVIEEKEDPGASTSLFIGAFQTNTGKSFAIDNISMKPSLELRKEGNPQTDNYPTSIARECRGYPEQESVACDYQDESGSIYTGWKGYCLLKDTAPGKSEDCIAWWPIDILAGEPDTTGRTRLTYSDKAPVYSCLVAKGNEQPGYCEDSGYLCTEDSECDSGETCIGGYDGNDAKCVFDQSGGTCDLFNPCDIGYDCNLSTGQCELETCTKDTGSGCSFGDGACWIYNSSGDGYCDYGQCDNTGLGGTDFCQVDSACGDVVEASTSDPDTDFNIQYSTDGSYVLNAQIASLLLDPGSHADTLHATEEYARFMEIEPSPVEKQIHISEIDSITFDIGFPQFVYFDDYDEEKDAWLMGNSTSTSATNKPWNGFNTAEWEEDLDSSGRLWSADYKGSEASGDPDSGDYISGVFASEGAGDNEDGVVAYQQGAWCPGEGDFCDADSSPEDMEDMDIIWTKAVASKDTYENIQAAGRIYNDGEPYNIFDVQSKLQPGGALWGKYGSIDEDNKVEGVAAPDDFPSRYSSDNADRKCWSAKPCGANVAGVKFDFEDGYLQKIYLFYWDGFRRFDTLEMIDIDWRYYLKEPCLLVIQGATDDAVAVPWRTRAAEGSSYYLSDIGYTYNINATNGAATNSMFGSIGDNSTTPDKIDGDDAEAGFTTSAMADFFAFAEYDLPQVYLNDGEGSGLPYACIGSCTAINCQNDYDLDYDGSDTESAGTCEDGRWIGIKGLCKTDGVPVQDSDGNAQVCSDDTDCTGGGTCSSLASAIEDKGGGGSYETQLKNAIQSGWQYYRLLFADYSGEVYYAPGNSDASTHLGKLIALDDEDEATEDVNFTGTDFLTQSEFDTTLQNSDGGSFANMQVCDNDERSQDEYCGLRPSVNTIQIDNNDTGDIIIQNGDAVSLTFNTAADPDQEPVNSIKVAWYVDPENDTDFSDVSYVNDPWEAASTEGHLYTNTYTCDPTSSYYNKYALGGPETGDESYDPAWGACVYKVWVQVTDNWNFCSGDSYTDTVRTNDGSCTSYDAYNGTIYVQY